MACQVAPQLFILSLFIRTERFPLFGHQADQAFDVIPALQQILMSASLIVSCWLRT